MNTTVSILGCGRLGLPLAKKLAHKYTVKGSTTTPEKKEELRAAGIKPYLINSRDLDINNYHLFLDTDILIICIPPLSYKVYEVLARDVARAGIKKVLFISATSVYPNNNKRVTEEDADYIKSPHSGRVMLKLEETFTQNEHLKTTVLRFCGLFGSGYIPGKFTFGIKNIEGGDHPINMIHFDDCIGIIEKVLEKEAWGKIYNACADHHPSRAEFYKKAAEAANADPPDFKEDEIQKTGYKIIDSSKIKKELGYELKYPDPIKAL